MDTSALASIADRAADRSALWADLLVDAGARHVAEIGVYRGVFAEKLLDSCPDIETYYLVDPWRHLDEWNKPANRSDADFEVIYAEALRRTEKHSTKRVVLRGRTTDVIDEIPDGSLDFAYVDGDHTLRGITLDLHRVYGKVRDGGWIGGDDFCRSIWQHSEAFEPTMVFPYAVYFAEAVGVPVFGLPFRQFLIVKQPGQGFSFVDLTASYGSTELLRQVRPPISASKGEPAGRRHATRIAVRAISRSSRAARRLKRRVAQRTSR